MDRRIVIAVLGAVVIFIVCQIIYQTLKWPKYFNHLGMTSEDVNNVREMIHSALSHPEKLSDLDTLLPRVPSSSAFDTVLQIATADNIIDDMHRTPFVLSKKLKTRGGLTDPDRELLGKVYFEANSVFEFGIGESTSIAAATNVPRYTGVDSDPKYVSIARNLAPDHFSFFFADIGKTTQWGQPIDGSMQKMALNYQIRPLWGEITAFDVYLVDGRFRVACALMSFIHAYSRGGDMDHVIVFIHDYDRNFYHIIEEVADPVISDLEKEGKLTGFKLKKDIPVNLLVEVWKAYRQQTN